MLRIDFLYKQISQLYLHVKMAIEIKYLYKISLLTCCFSGPSMISIIKILEEP